MPDPQSGFFERRQQLAERVGEPVLLMIRIGYDDWFAVQIQTFTDRWGMAAGREVEAAVAGAVEMLLAMDDVLAEVIAGKESCDIACQAATGPRARCVSRGRRRQQACGPARWPLVRADMDQKRLNRLPAPAQCG